jgi:hypothetical protein
MPDMENSYVAGVAFNGRKPDKVLLIRKARPTWQLGLFNGIGGHIRKFELDECTEVTTKDCDPQETC